MLTRDELREELARFPTREEPTRLPMREWLRAEFADLKLRLKICHRDLKSMLLELQDAIVSRIDARDVPVDRHLDDHGRQVAGLEGRVTHLAQKIH